MTKLTTIAWPVARKLTRYGSHPVCPRCGYDQYDDWWHELRGDRPHGKLECGSCEKLFFIEGEPGNLFSTCFGLDETDRLLRTFLTPPSALSIEQGETP